MKWIEIFESFSPIKKQEYIDKSMGDKILAAAKRNGDDKEHSTSLDIIKQLTKADPTIAFDFLNFICNIYVKNELRLEDIPRLRTDLKEFVRVRPKLQNKDISSYRTLDQLYSVLEPFKEVRVSTNASEVKKIKDEGVEKLIYEPDFKAFIVKTKEAACFYGAGTKWCTAAETDNAFDTYNKQGPLIVIIAKQNGKDVKFQLHYESGQFMNERDLPISAAEIKLLSQFPEYSKLVNKLTSKHY